MFFLSIILAGLSLLIWIVLTFFRGAFWQLWAFDGDAPAEEQMQAWPRVAVVVPARDEAETIARCALALVEQDYPGDFQVFVVDDHSSDGTAALAREATESARGAHGVTVLQAAELQAGWTGKLWALEQGISAAAAGAPKYFWLTDADIVHAPDTLRRLVARAEGQNLDLVSLMALLQVKSVPERLLTPAFLYFFLKLYPPKWVADAKSGTAGAAGGCILLRKGALERIGGVAAIRGEVIEDCAMARAVKRSGGGVWLGLTRKSVSLRTYSTLGEIRDAIARSAFTQLGYSGLLLLGTLVAMALIYFVPVILVFSSQPVVWRVSLAAWALMTVTYLPTLRFYRLGPLWAPLLPLAALFYSYATWISAVRYWMGRGGEWKGRAQAGGRSGPE